MKKSLLGIVVLGVLFVLPVNACECLKGLFSTRPATVQHIIPAIQPGPPAVPQAQAMADQPDAAPLALPVAAPVQVQNVYNVNVNVIHSRSGSMALSPRSVAQLPPGLVSPAGSRHPSLRTMNPVVFVLPSAAPRSAAQAGSASQSRVTFAEESTHEVDGEVLAVAANPGAILSPSKLAGRTVHSILSPGLNVRTFIESSAKVQKKEKRVSFSKAESHEGDADSDHDGGQSPTTTPVHQYRRLKGSAPAKKILGAKSSPDSDLFGPESSFSKKYKREEWGLETPDAAGPIIDSPTLVAIKTQKEMWQQLKAKTRAKRRFKKAALGIMFINALKNVQSKKEAVEEA